MKLHYPWSPTSKSVMYGQGFYVTDDDCFTIVKGHNRWFISPRLCCIHYHRDLYKAFTTAGMTDAFFPTRQAASTALQTLMEAQQ